VLPGFKALLIMHSTPLLLSGTTHPSWPPSSGQAVMLQAPHIGQS
jgi:hypothetical protein